MAAKNFTIRLRVRVQDTQSIIGIEESQTFAVDGRNLSVKMDPPILTISASGFGYEEEAERFLPRLKAGLFNIALAHGLSFKPEFQRTKIHRPKDPRQAALNHFPAGDSGPEKIDGVGSGEGYYIQHSEETIYWVTTYPASIGVGLNWENLRDSFIEGVKNGKKVDEGEALATAFDLYLSSFYERTPKAQFITLVSCLEVLAPEGNRQPEVVRLFREFQTRLKEAQGHTADAALKDAFQAAINDTRWKKKQSISERIRELVRSSTFDEDSEPDAFVSHVIKAYDVRGFLLHKGRVDEAEFRMAHDTIRKAVRRVLASRLGLS